MKFIHATSAVNKDSILQHGILPSVPYLEQWQNFHLQYNDYDKDLGVVFTFAEHEQQRDKYIKDVIYWKCWGFPRNKFLQDLSYDEFIDARDIGPSTFKHVKYTEGDFIVFEVDVEVSDIYLDKSYSAYHHQSREMNNLWTDMDERFEHGNKLTYTFNKVIKPVDIKIVGKASLYFDKRYKAVINLNL